MPVMMCSLRPILLVVFTVGFSGAERVGDTAEHFRVSQVHFSLIQVGIERRAAQVPQLQPPPPETVRGNPMIPGLPLAQSTGKCVEDMCIKDAVDYVASNLREESKVDVQEIKPACPKWPTSSTRLILNAVVDAFHGSTALEEVVMSSPSVATLCSCGSWQCEAAALARLKNQTAWSFNYNFMLDVLSQCWNLSRPVYFQKYMLIEECGPSIRKAQGGPWDCQAAEVDHFAKSFSQVHPSKLMTAAGVRTLDIAYLLLWRPLCMAPLSSHAMHRIKKGQTHILSQKELWKLEQMVKMHQSLTSKRVPVLVIGLGSMVWEPSRNKARLERFAPCMGHLDINYVPAVGQDVVENNQFKAEASVKEFGQQLDPSSYYDVTSRRCTDLSLLRHNTDEERARYDWAERYLAQYS